MTVTEKTSASPNQNCFRNDDKPLVVVLSDDLTGAVAAAGEAMRAGASAHVLPWASSIIEPSADVIVLDTNSRLLDAPSAAARVRETLRRVHRDFGSGVVYYKRLDSQLRGPVVAEVEEFTKFCDFAAILAIAAPSLGITTRGGIQFRYGSRMEIVAAGKDVATVMPRDILRYSHVVDVETIRDESNFPGLAESLSGGKSLCLDVESSADLVAAARLAHFSASTSLIGSYGLLGAWVEELRCRRSVGTLVAATSYRAATAAQVAKFENSVSSEVFKISQIGNPPVGEIMHSLESGNDVLLMPGEMLADNANAGPAVQIAEFLVTILRKVWPSGLVLIGGELSSATLSEIRPNRLVVLSEPWPATPILRIAGPFCDGLPVVIQSGSQGDPDRLLHIISALRGVATVKRELSGKEIL